MAENKPKKQCFYCQTTKDLRLESRPRGPRGPYDWTCEKCYDPGERGVTFDNLELGYDDDQ